MNPTNLELVRWVLGVAGTLVVTAITLAWRFHRHSMSEVRRSTEEAGKQTAAITKISTFLEETLPLKLGEAQSNVVDRVTKNSDLGFERVNGRIDGIDSMYRGLTRELDGAKGDIKRHDAQLDDHAQRIERLEETPLNRVLGWPGTQAPPKAD
jgi:hypothetical protein